MIPTINRPTSVKRWTATTIDHSITNKVQDIQFMSKIIQVDIMGHFPVTFAFQLNKNIVEKHAKYFVFKRYLDKKLANLFQQNWKLLEIFSSINRSKKNVPKKRTIMNLKN